MASRRAIILGAGSAGVALAATGATWKVTRLPVTASAPWALDPTPPKDVRLDAFRHAILAPNPHNRQPWELTLIGSDEALIHCDLDKRLPETDPFDRQIVIGFGAFVELAVIAASRRGQRVEVTPFPEGAGQPRLDRRPIARLKFIRDTQVQPSPRAAAILERRSVKQPFDAARPLAESDAVALKATAGDGLRWAMARQPNEVSAITAIAVDAWRREALTHRTMKESVDLMRIGAAEVDALPDGIALKGPMIESLRLAGLLDRPALLDPSTQAFRAGEKTYVAMLTATASHAWLVSDTSTREAQLAAGRAYMRFALDATTRGLSVHPISQALQEFPEMAPHYQAMHKALNVQPGEQLQMLVRIGYGPKVAPAPRWPLDRKLRPHDRRA